MIEEWREVYGFDILFEVSNLGRVRTKYVKKVGYTPNYRILNPIDNGKGYLRFNFKCSGKDRTVYVHRMVSEAFLPNPDHLQEVNHIDENKYNNVVTNLEWCTGTYNKQYGTAHERAMEKRRLPIVCNETGIVYKSMKEAAEEMNVCVTAISNCLKGRSKTSRGYTWSYYNVDVI